MALNTRKYVDWMALTAITACVAALTGCDTPSSRSGGLGFVSDNPDGSGSPDKGGEDVGGTGSSSTGTGAGGPGEPAAPGDDAERAIAEADIIQVHEGKLYALSQYSGLSVIDVSVQDQLALLGRYQVAGTPFEMYLRDGVVYAMFSSYGQYVYDAATTSYSWVQSSRIEALDVADPANIQRLGSFDLPGTVSDSRIVGDVLYAVSYEDGYCWNCASSPNTTVTSLSVGDPAAVAVVDRLTYGAPNDPWGYGWYRRSVSVTPDRMYVAGIEWDGSSEGHSTIQVIDISDPTGQLVEGASVEAVGQIESRWQMDEHEGVLRVISQPGVWWNGAGVPAVQTFTIVSSNNLQPLGYKEMVLPKPETLRSVRFDGTRAYAITAEQIDPLFVFDLSNPAQPAQLGELEMPGWIYHMEPRGDRLLALGFDNTSAEGSLHVSLFDVADMSNPIMLSRVPFGGDWSNLAEDQDRIHKAFTIDDEHGAIFVPYSGWEYQQDTYGCGAYHSGIQIIDYSNDTLAARGVAPSRGQARRAFVHGERLFAVSDADVRTFDITDRDAPASAAELALSTHVDQAVIVGDLVARVSADWWTTEARLDIVPLSDPGRADPIGSLDLSALDSDPTDTCVAGELYGARMFTNGQHVYLVWTEWGYEYNNATSHVAAIDLSDPTAPRLEGRIDLPFSTYSYGSPSAYAVVSSGDSIVQIGSTLVFSEISYDYNDPGAGEQAQLQIVDLSNPASPVLASTHSLPWGIGHTLLRTDGATVLSSHWVPMVNDKTKVRFFVDRVDVANPSAPATLPSVNVPGSLVSLDSETGRMLTVDYERMTLPKVTYDECYQAFGWNSTFEQEEPGVSDTGDCIGMHRTFKLVDVQGATATLIAESPIGDGTYLSDVLVGDDRVFASASDYGWAIEYDGYGYNGSRLIAVGGMRDGAIVVGSYNLGEAEYAYPVAVDGARLVTTGYNPPSISVLDASDLGALTYEQKGELSGYYSNTVTLDGDLALCSMGPYGLDVIDLGN